jgi:non-specific serine/threonine protein kinase
MRATIAWSENLLTTEERVIFRRLAVFVGGCTLEAAEAVCAAPEGAERLDLDMLDGLSTLVDQSLAQQREEGGEPRFGMLHVIREYALERLEASGEAEAVRGAHAADMVALAERAEPELRGPEAAAWLDRLEREHDNLRAALGWARERGDAETGLRLAAALWDFWVGRGHLREGRAWVEAVEALASGSAGTAGGGMVAVRARALHGGGSLAKWLGDITTAQRWQEEAAALGRSAGDSRTTARALSALGVIARQERNLERATVCFAESLALARELGDRRGIATGLVNLGNVAADQGTLERARAHFMEALALFRQMGDREGAAICLGNLGETVRIQGEAAQAEALGREALALFWEMGDARRCAEGLEELARTAAAAARGARAARLLGAAAALRETLGAPQPPHERADTERDVAAARAALGEEAWAAALAAGQALSLKEVVAEALGEE